MSSIDSVPLFGSRTPTNPITIPGSIEEDINEQELLGKWQEEDGGVGKERQVLTPVSEVPDEFLDEEDEGLIMYDIREAGAPAPPDGGWGWVVVFASFMCNLMLDGIVYTFGVFLPVFAESFNEGKGKVAWVGSLLCGTYLCAGPVVSALTNKFGCRPVCFSGSIVASAGFALSAFSPNLSVLMLTYGIIGGIGFGLIYLPAVVCVGYYFESKRALATGIAVCGSGVGTVVFAPFAAWLLSVTDWRNANLILAALLLSCGIFAMMMRPLEVQIEPLYDDDDDTEYNERCHQYGRKPLLQRMADDKRNYLEKGSFAGSAYFMVQLPDGTMERRMKMPLNVDPGVHSGFNLDQLVPGTPVTPMPTVGTLPTITESKVTEGSSSRAGSEEASKEGSSDELKKSENDIKTKEEEEKNEISGSVTTIKGDENNPFHFPMIPQPVLEQHEHEENANTKVESNLKEATLESHEDDVHLSNIVLAQKRSLRERRHSEGISSHSISIVANMTPPSNTKQTGHQGVQDGAVSRSPSRPTSVRPGTAAVPIPSRLTVNAGSIPRNGSAPQFRQIPRNGSASAMERVARKHSYKAVPVGSASSKLSASKTTLPDNRRSSNQFKSSISSFMGSKNNNNENVDEDYTSLWSKNELSDQGLIFSSSQKTPQAETRHIVRPLSRKDIFYSGSIVHLPEYQSQKSINSYRQSILNIPREYSAAEFTDGTTIRYSSPKKSKRGICPCINTGAMYSVFAQILDANLLKNPVFHFIAISNIFGMLGFYPPFVFLIDAAVEKGLEEGQAASLLSVIGITNTIGRVVAGMISDLPQVNSLLMNNICVLMAGICTALLPFCSSYISYLAVAIFFGSFIAGYVSLTSIILVDLLGLEFLTSAFGLLMLFRGGASMVGSPLAGAVYDAFKTYDVPFFLSGGFLAIAAVVSFMIPLVSKFAPRKTILEPPLTSQGGHLEDIPEAAESYNNSEDFEKCNHAESAL